MPRWSRVDAPGTIHHVMVRGIERRPIFADDIDREDLLARLSRVLPESGIRCFAWALMPNHAHLVIQTAEVPISRAMARIGTGYARRFNERHDRVGHLFQNRFKSRSLGDEADLIGVIRYVHLNPLSGAIVDTLDELASYPWAGHAALMGRSEPRAFHSLAATLALFAESTREARSRLRVFMSEGLLTHADRSGLEAADGGGPSHGSGAISRAAKGATESDLHPSLEPWVTRVCGHFDVDADALRGGSKLRALSRARAVLAHLAVTRLGLEVTRVAPAFGVCASALSRAARRGAAIARAEAIDLGDPRGEASQQRPRSQRSQQSQERPRSKL